MPDLRLSPSDLDELKRHGIEEAEASRQLDLLRNPPPKTRLARPAKLGDGILSPTDLGNLDTACHDARTDHATVKFVPASGAATRMFRDLQAALDGSTDPAARGALERFEREWKRLPFSSQLPPSGATQARLQHLLQPSGLGYASLPKGLVLFHRYSERDVRTAFEDQLVEAASLFAGAPTVRAHFTVGAEHEERFRQTLEASGAFLESRLACRFDVSFSQQSASTDTLSLDESGVPVRDGQGRLVLRPGGHGALIGNLQALAREGAEYAVIKNIDNVRPEPAQSASIRILESLLGLVHRTATECHEVCRRLREGGDADTIASAMHLAERLHCTPLDREPETLLQLLDRPLRACGVVPNTGEPGGGPFWVRGPDGRESLQIVETAQVDPDDEGQTALLADSTHFNPVLLVCSLRDSRGRAFELDRYVDPSTCFIAHKSVDGRPLRALERPGLWNGAMARWNTFFVEAPLEAFSPVKTVFDLLRPEHQAS